MPSWDPPLYPFRPKIEHMPEKHPLPGPPTRVTTPPTYAEELMQAAKAVGDLLKAQEEAQKVMRAASNKLTEARNDLIELAQDEDDL